MAKNIVILTMGLDIGGAETHIMELACALKSKGHNVTVFSNGGVFVPLLEAQGIKHIKAPMNTKKPSALFKSTRILTKFCKENRVSVIHSHTRITNYIANKVCKKFDIPMVTTVHFNFKLNAVTRALSHWGSRALSVSEDLREYVVKGYGVRRDHVRITVNGINLTTFSQGTNPELRKQYDLKEEHKVILCVSRIDTGACENVFRFLESAKEIYDAVPSARIIIVGNGNRFEELQEIAANLNAQTTPDYVQLAGAQTNISDYLRMADAFAGVSRSALEAIACRLPTILIGNAGYLGVYSDDIRQACIDTNFTCRGYDYVSPHEVAEIMIGMLTRPEDYSENIEKAYRLVEKRYSVFAMADDALASYAEAENDMRPCDLMLSGYYGMHNFGDDITLQAIISNISKHYPVDSVTVLSHTDKNEYQDERINVIHRFNLFKILPAMKKTKLFMLGGGSLLQDATSNRSIFYYLFMLRRAQNLGCKTMIYGNGIGPICKKKHRKNTIKVLQKVNRITIRDNESYQYLLQNGLDKDKLELTADETFNFYDFDLTQSAPLPDTNGKKILLINLRPYINAPKDITKDVATAVEKIARQNDLYPVLLPIQFTQDYALLKRVSEMLTVEHHLFDRQVQQQDIISLINSCHILLTERLHPIVFAARLQKPFVSIVYDPKVRVTAQIFKMENYALSLTEMSSERIIELMNQLLKEYSSIQSLLLPIAKEQQVSAVRNSEIAADLLHE